MAFSGASLCLDVDWRVDASAHIYMSNLPLQIRSLMLRYSMVVNSIDTPCQPEDIVPIISEYLPGPIRQVWYVYQAPWFQRYRQYSPPKEEGISVSWGSPIDENQPWFYGFMRHPDSSFTVVFYVRQAVIQSVWTRTRIDPQNHALIAIFSHYRRVVEILEKSGIPDPKMLAMVGILPGIAIKRERQLVWYSDIIQMQIQKNLNSWRFIGAAVRRLMDDKNVLEKDLVILGAWWTLWSAVAVAFPGAKLIDIHNKDSLNEKSSSKRIIIDCTTGWSMEEYLSLLTQSDIWVNEAFPPPLLPVVQRAKSLWIEVYHIPGVEGETIPPLPPGYWLTPPCCMGLTDPDIQPSDSVMIEPWNWVEL